MISRPLHIAASRHLVDTCESLLIKGASVSIKDNQGLNPVLCTATSDDGLTCLTMLLEAVKLEAQANNYSRSSIIHAVRRSINSFGKKYFLEIYDTNNELHQWQFSLNFNYD